MRSDCGTASGALDLGARGGGLRLGRLERAEKRGDRGGEDVLVEVVLAREVDGAVQLDDDVLARARRKEVDPHEVDAQGRRRGDSEVARTGRRGNRSTGPAEGDVRPPVAGGRVAL